MVVEFKSALGPRPTMASSIHTQRHDGVEIWMEFEDAEANSTAVAELAETNPKFAIEARASFGDE